MGLYPSGVCRHKSISLALLVAAFAVQRTGIVYTCDVGDFRALGEFFPSLRVFAI
jgi:hypothetical protein